MVIVLTAKPKQNDVAVTRVIKVAFFIVAVLFCVCFPLACYGLACGVKKLPATLVFPYFRKYAFFVKYLYFDGLYHPSPVHAAAKKPGNT